MDKGRFNYWGACRKFGTRYIHTLPYQRLHKQHEKPALFPRSSYLLAAVETHGVFNHTTTRNNKQQFTGVSRNRAVERRPEAWVVEGKKHDTAHNESCGNSAMVQWQQLSAAVAVQRVVAVETADR